MQCEEQLALQRLFEDATTTFDTARTALTDRIGVCLKVEFRSLSRELDRGWINLSRARRALHDHVMTHNCRGNSP